MPPEPPARDDGVLPKASTERQRLYMARAARMALKSIMTHKHGCVLVAADGMIVSEGYNHHKVHMSHKFSIHAEVDALHKAKKRLRKRLAECEMYVVRIGPGRLKYSKPCLDCAQEIERHGIRRVYYSTETA